MNKKSIIILLFVLGGLTHGFTQTILPPDLQCVVNDAVNGDITLYWANPPTNPCGPFIQYTIYASQTGPGGPYIAVAVTSQTATSFLLTGYLAANPTWDFYMEATYNCPGATVLQSDTVDNLNPSTPLIINVDVTPGQDVVFNWEPGPSPQTAFYIIYYYLPNGNAVPLDTVYGRFNTTYTDVVADPTTQSLVYTVAAVDSCGRPSAFNTEPHNTILLNASITACQNQIDLAWNEYKNWPSGVKRYEVFIANNDNNFTEVGNVNGSTLTFNYSGFNDGDSLCIFVRAISDEDSVIVSNSNIVCLEAAIVQPPSYIFITNATVNLFNQIEVTWIIDTTAELTFYRTMRSGNNSTYSQIDQTGVPIPLNHFETFIDSVNVIPENSPYFYQVTAFDSCQNQYTTPYVKTINLRGELYDYYIANLVWNDFELQGATILQYNVYRNYGSGNQLIRTLPPGVNTYSDSLQQFLNEKGIFCYRIEAVYDYNVPGIYSEVLSSFSNEVCIYHRPIIYIPNAFAPEGLNNIFKPTIIYGEPKAYTMQIYNRWGGLVFESNDPATGWDGTDHGKNAQPGGYAYLIQFYANDGVKVERKGMVLLVR